MPPITPAPTDVPDDEAENVSSATVENIILSHSDSDSESENIDHDGYELLSQDPENFFSVENDENDCNSTSDIEESVTAEVNNLNSSSLHSLSLVHPTNERTSQSVTMSEAQIETIKSVMKGITLPSCNLPQWANLIPEEEWKAALLSEMHSRQMKNRDAQSSRSSNKVHMTNDVLR